MGDGHVFIESVTGEGCMREREKKKQVLYRLMHTHTERVSDRTSWYGRISIKFIAHVIARLPERIVMCLCVFGRRVQCRLLDDQICVIDF